MQGSQPSTPPAAQCNLTADRSTPTEYSNAGDKPWQTAVLGGTQRMQFAIFEWASAIC
jgi:hypothetical protein